MLLLHTISASAAVAVCRCRRCDPQRCDRTNSSASTLMGREQCSERCGRIGGPDVHQMRMRCRCVLGAHEEESTMAGRDRMLVVWCRSDWLMRVAVLSSTQWMDGSIDRWMDCVRRDARLEMPHVSVMQLAPSRNNTCCEESGGDSVCKKGSCTRGKCIKRRCCNHSRNDTEACRGAYVQMRA